jgi:hypothetical protein
MKTNIHFWSYLAQFFFEWNIFRQKLYIKSKHIFSVLSFLKSCRYVEKYCRASRPQMTIWCKHIACWMSKATNKHIGCVIFVAFQLQQWNHERASVLRYTYTVFRDLSVFIIQMKIINAQQARIIHHYKTTN